MKCRILLAAAATIALAACNSADDADNSATADAGMTEPATVNPDMTADDSMPATAQAFADKASASDMFEIEAGKLAQEMGKSQAIKDFAAMMVKDHTKSSSDLKAAAAKANGVTVNPKLSAKQQADLDALRSAGPNFDATYKQQQVAAHEQALSMLQNYAQSGDDAALKDFAGKAAPVVEGHLKQARDLS